MLYQVIALAFLTVSNAHLEPFDACSVHPCNEGMLNKCVLRGETWAAVLYDNRRVCVCCTDEKYAHLTAASSATRGKGLFFGNEDSVCETIPIDEVRCTRRRSRDCNYQVISDKGSYVGCFYCRPACSSNHECKDLECECGVKNRYQPTRSCTFVTYHEKNGINFATLYEDLINGYASGTLSDKLDGGAQSPNITNVQAVKVTA